MREPGPGPHAALLNQINALLDGVEQGTGTWTEVLQQLARLERVIRHFEPDVRAPLLGLIQHTEHFAERGHLAMTRVCVGRLEQALG